MGSKHGKTELKKHKNNIPHGTHRVHSSSLSVKRRNKCSEELNMLSIRI